jgi:tellurite methyltransferase
MDEPSSFIVAALSKLPAPSRAARALDVATGAGRHAIVLARAGYRTFGVDWRLDALRAARAAADQAGVSLALWVADLTQWRPPIGWFDLVVCTRYLDRSFLAPLSDTLRAGGILLFETFTTDQLRYDRGPRSREHLLHPGELRRAFSTLTTLFSEEVDRPDAVARLIARRDG